MGFPCSTLSYKERSDSPFCARVFPRINQRKRKKVKANDLIDVFNDDKLWSQLFDDDAVRVCLIIVVELVFIGRQSSYYIPNHIVTLVEDFDDWNAYPWGEYLWRRLYEKIVNVVPVHYNWYYKKKIDTDPNKLATYNLEGFVWALKIWILGTHPNSKIWWQKNPTKTPCGVAWSKLKTCSKREYSVLFGLVDTPILVKPEIVGEDASVEVPAHVVAKDASVEVPELVDDVRAHIVAKDATVDEVSSDREVVTLKTILGLIDKAGGNVAVVDVVRKRLAAIEKFPEQSVNNDSVNVMLIHNAEDGKLFHTNDAKENLEFDDYMELDKEGNKAIQLSLDDHTSSSGFADDYDETVLDKEQSNTPFEFGLGDGNEAEKEKEDAHEDDKVGVAVLEKEENKADPDDEKVREAVLDTEENNVDKYSIAAISVQGKEDDCVEEKVGEALLDNEENSVEMDDVHKPEKTTVTKDFQNQMMYSDLVEKKSPKFNNVVKVGDRPCAVDVFNTVKRKSNELKRTRYLGNAYKSPYMEKGPTTPTVPKRRFKRINESALMLIPFAADDEEIDVSEWTEHLDLWVDLMWSFRPSNANWAMAGPFFYFGLSTAGPSKATVMEYGILFHGPMLRRYAFLLMYPRTTIFLLSYKSVMEL